MPEITLRRKDYEVDDHRAEHAGLKLARGFGQWDTEKNEYNEQKQQFYDQLTQIIPSELYKKAYQRWKMVLRENTKTSKTWAGKIDGRLYLGLGEANSLESAITLHQTYGVPFIPGSAVKGVLHHALLAEYKNNPDEDMQHIIDTLFGREPNETDKQDSGSAGYLIFNDAWWIPGGKNPLVKEVITVHHQDYYADQGKTPATDFDSPNPNSQIAIQGSFLFSVEGEEQWAEYAIKLLKNTLENKGIGAKTASGYGYFDEDLKYQKILKENEIDSAPPEDKIALMVNNLTLDELPTELGKSRNKTKDKIGQQYWELYLEKLVEKFSEQIKDWETSSEGNKQKAYKTMHGKWSPQWKDDN